MIPLQILTNLETKPPEIKRESLVDASISAVGRLPRGMGSGKSSVTVYAQLREPLQLADGRLITHVFCETSLALFDAANSAFRGAEQRDEDERRRIISNG